MITLSDASIGYGNTLVLRHLNHTFSCQEFTCMIGKNGCGKSTLLRAICGLLPSYEGSIRYAGAELRDIPRRERASQISFLPQARPVPAMDVRTLLAHGRYPHLGFSKALSKKDKEMVAYAARVAGIAELLDREISTLSGGERQRAYIAMTIAQDAEMILLDEPATYLDIEHQLEIMRLLVTLHQKGKGIVMVAHDLPQAFSFSTKICLVGNGGIAASGKPEELCGHPALIQTMGVSISPSREKDDIYAYRLSKEPAS